MTLVFVGLRAAAAAAPVFNLSTLKYLSRRLFEIFFASSHDRRRRRERGKKPGNTGGAILLIKAGKKLVVKQKLEM